MTDRDDQIRAEGIKAERAKLEELLMQRVTGALSAPEADALARALSASSDQEALALEWELAAAELSAVMALDAQTPADALPPHLAERIIGVGEALTRTQQRDPARPPTIAPISEARTTSPWRAAAQWGGWMLAAAAATLVVLRPTPAPTPAIPVVSSAQRGQVLRDSLLNADSALVRLAWTATADSSARGATGDVVWSARAQRGVMRIAGLQSNDRSKTQYQLWIFDKNRDERYPVDGGVFDVPPGAHEVFVPIDARVPVGEAVLFAITVEPPGGVVVSTRERIALVAKPAG